MNSFFVLIGCALIAGATAAAFEPSEKVPIAPYGEVAVEPAPLEGRITNGQPATDGQFPSQVALYSERAGGTYFCGGSLIARNWILTAAHCTVEVTRVTAYLGSYLRNSPRLYFTVDSRDIITHEKYVASTLTNDIALIRTPTVTYNAYIQPAKLPALSSPNYAGEFSIASGWGRTSDTSSVSNILNWVRLQVIPNSECAKYYGSAVVDSNTMCVATPQGKSTCQGDSGGPLMHESTNLLIGITSFVAAIGCTAGYPSGFTRVNGYTPWIQQHTGPLV